MKDFHVTFLTAQGPREYKVTYTSEIGKQLKKRFNKPLIELAMGDVLGWQASERGFKPARVFDPEARDAFIAAGLLNAGTKWTEQRVSQAIQDHMDNGGDAQEIAAVCVKAAFYQGMVLGYRYDLDADEGEEGKAPEPSPAPTTAIRAAE